MTTIIAPLTTIALAGLVPDVVRSCIVLQPSPPPDPGEEPPDPVGDTGIYTPIAPGVIYDSLPTTTVIDTSPDQMIGCIVTVADNPQGRLNALFPSAISGDGVIDRATNDIWVYDGAVWNNVGPTPGPTIVATTVIPPWNETVLAAARTRTKLEALSLAYALELLTEPDPITTLTSLLARSIPAYIKVGAIDLTASGQIPAVTTGAGVFSPISVLSFSGVIPQISSGVSVAVPVADTAFEAKEIPYVGKFATVMSIDTSLEATTAGLIPIVSSGVSISVPVADATVAALVPLLNPPVDPYFDYVSLLLHLDGANGSTTITDSSNNAFAVTLFGNSSISTSISQFGGASLFCSSGSPRGYTSASGTALSLGILDPWTVEQWVYPNNSTYARALWSNATLINNNSNSISGLIAFSGGLFRVRCLIANTFKSTILLATTGYIFSYPAWYHIAYAFDGTTLRIFVNGVLQVSGTLSSTSDFTAPNNFFVGAYPTSSSTSYFAGYIDECRVTKGLARYTTNFTVPTAPFPNL